MTIHILSVPRACHPLKAIVHTSFYWNILTASLKMPGDHAVIFRKDVPIQGFSSILTVSTSLRALGWQ